MRSLILGGARSGKSSHAQRLAQASGLPVTLIATGQARDPEMADRIARHRADRPAAWQTLETPLHLADALAHTAQAGQCVVVDCLTLWLLNLLEAGEGVFETEREKLLATVPRLGGMVIFVANEVGLGVVPMGALSRRFVDEAGRLNQDLARLVERVSFVAAGLPLALKGGAP